jgi:hypothetical protein
MAGGPARGWTGALVKEAGWNPLDLRIVKSSLQFASTQWPNVRKLFTTTWRFLFLSAMAFFPPSGAAAIALA